MKNLYLIIALLLTFISLNAQPGLTPSSGRNYLFVENNCLLEVYFDGRVYRSFDVPTLRWVVTTRANRIHVTLFDNVTTFSFRNIDIASYQPTSQAADLLIADLETYKANCLTGGGGGIDTIYTDSTLAGDGSLGDPLRVVGGGGGDLNLPTCEPCLPPTIDSLFSGNTVISSNPLMETLASALGGITLLWQPADSLADLDAPDGNSVLLSGGTDTIGYPFANILGATVDISDTCGCDVTNVSLFLYPDSIGAIPDPGFPGDTLSITVLMTWSGGGDLADSAVILTNPSIASGFTAQYNNFFNDKWNKYYEFPLYPTVPPSASIFLQPVPVDSLAAGIKFANLDLSDMTSFDVAFFSISNSTFIDMNAAYVVVEKVCPSLGNTEFFVIYDCLTGEYSLDTSGSSGFWYLDNDFLQTDITKVSIDSLYLQFGAIEPTGCGGIPAGGTGGVNPTNNGVTYLGPDGLFALLSGPGATDGSGSITSNSFFVDGIRDTIFDDGLGPIGSEFSITNDLVCDCYVETVTVDVYWTCDSFPVGGMAAGIYIESPINGNYWVDFGGQPIFGPSGCNPGVADTFSITVPLQTVVSRIDVGFIYFGAYFQLDAADINLIGVDCSPIQPIGLLSVDSTGKVVVGGAAGGGDNIYNTDGIQTEASRTYDGDQGDLLFNNLQSYFVGARDQIELFVQPQDTLSSSAIYARAIDFFNNWDARLWVNSSNNFANASIEASHYPNGRFSQISVNPYSASLNASDGLSGDYTSVNVESTIGITFQGQSLATPFSYSFPLTSPPAFGYIIESDGIGGTKWAIGKREARQVHTPNTTTGDSSLAVVNVFAGDNPHQYTIPMVFVNGVLVLVEENIIPTTGECYFAEPGTPALPVPFELLDGTENLYWNGVVAGYNLSPTDQIIIHYDKDY